MAGDEPTAHSSGAGQPDPTVTRRAGAGALVRRLAIDVSPLRRSRDYRYLWFGQLVGLTGRQITAVALPYQVFLLTGSSLAVGLIGLAQVVPLAGFALLGGPFVDRLDRRKLILVTEAGMACTSIGLLAGAVTGDPPLWLLYVLAGLQAGLSGISGPARSAALPTLVGRDLVPAAMALTQVLFNMSMIVGPAAAGLILARYGLAWAYGAELISFVGSIAAVAMLRPLPPSRGEGEEGPSGLSALREGFSYLRSRRVLIGTFVIDLNAMIFGMPRALFPVLALTVFEVGPEGLGLLYAAPAVGALVAALTAGWVGRVKHQGRAVIWAVALWGAAIAAFGLSGGAFLLALVFLALAGAADVISAVFRGTILQLSVPDALRGRMSSVHILVVTGGPRLGDVEAGAVAALVSPAFSVISGGLACVAGAFLLAALIPDLVGYHASDAEADSTTRAGVVDGRGVDEVMAPHPRHSLLPGRRRSAPTK